MKISPYLTLVEARRLLEKKAISPQELLEHTLENIENKNPKIHAYLSWNREKALKEAINADLSLPLGGIPIGIKDAIAVAGEPLTAASQLLANYHSPYNATVIEKLRQAGGYPLGRLNMDEFALGSSTENSSMGVTLNPWDYGRIPGGSSGGSAAAVGGGLAMAALGSDTGGSIRQPAALCGCVGLKPTYGRVSRYGLIACASSLDQIGPMTHTVADNALLFQAIAGNDPRDTTSRNLAPEDFMATLGKDIRGIKIGIPKEYFIDGIEVGVEQRVRHAITQFQDLGAEIVEISLPHTDYAVATYYIIMTAEVSANLARFDGVRYGKRSPEAKDLLSLYEKSREEGLGAEVKRRIILGTYVLSSGYYDAYYLKAQKVRRLIQEDFDHAFEKVDLILSPTSPETAFALGEKKSDPLKMYLADIFTLAANLGGVCGLSLPCGFSDDHGVRLPVGLQLLAPGFQEARLFQVGDAYQQATNWHEEHPS